MGTDREINNLLNEFLQLETDEQRRQFQGKIAHTLSGKTEEEKREFAEILSNKAQQTIDQSQALIDEYDFKQALKDIVPAITWSYIAEEYFNKSRSWFSQRMNGYHVNNKVATQFQLFIYQTTCVEEFLYWQSTSWNPCFQLFHRRVIFHNEPVSVLNVIFD